MIITHDLGVVAEIADEIAVMYAGPDRRARHGRRDLRRTPAPVHVGPAEVDPAPRQPARRGARADPGPPAEPDQPALRLPLPSPLPVRARPHKRIDPQLEPVDGEPEPRVACLLEPDDRASGCGELSRGATPRAARRSTARAVAERRRRRRRAPRQHRRVAVERQPATPLLEVRDLVKHFPITRGVLFQRQIGAVKAVDGIAFDVKQRRDARDRRRDRAAARAPPRGCSCACSTRRAGRSRSTGDDIATRQRATRSRRCTARCRWSSRTPTRR